MASKPLNAPLRGFFFELVDMQNQFLTSVIAAISAWFLIEQVKTYRAKNAETIEPVAGIAQQETDSETYV
jgi:hypothetical protein